MEHEGKQGSPHADGAALVLLWPWGSPLARAGGTPVPGHHPQPPVPKEGARSDAALSREQELKAL